MKKLILGLSVIVLTINMVAQTVVTPEWVKNYSDRDNMTNIPSAIDANGNIYVTGSVRTVSQDYNFATIKYNQSGDTLWVKKYNGIANNSDEAIAIVLDASGNIIIVGKSKNINGDYDIVTLKYDPNGNLVFENRYNSPLNGDDIPTDVTVDNSGNIYTVGYSKQTGTFDSYITVKYLSNGAQSWLKTYSAAATGNNRATGVFWKNNRLFVTGYSFQTSGTFAVTTLSYHAGNGVVLWTKNYGSIAVMPSTPAKIANFSNNIYVSGSVGTATNMNYSLVSYTLSNGNQQWAKTYDSYGLNDFSTSLVSDNSGNVFLTGRSLNTGNEYEYHTIKYNSSGSQIWVNKYPVKILNTLVNNKIAIDPYNTIYVCGEVKAGNARDMLLFQLNQSGNMQWDETYNGLANGADGATDMVIDAQGRIFLTGQTQNNVAKFDYTTIKLSQSYVYNPIDLNNEPRQSSFDYIANKGQLADINNVLIPEIKYYVPNSWPGLYFTPTRISYVFEKSDTIQSTPDTLHRIDMSFENCNSLARIFPVDTTIGFTNYYLPSCPSGVNNVKGFERLFVPNIYPNIDLHYYSNNAGLKMYFVLKPGANPKDIAFIFNGQDNLAVNTNKLEITSSLGITSFAQPQAYMVNYGQQIVPVNWQPQWQVTGNRANFTTGNWNGNFPLIIMIDKGTLSQQQTQTYNIEWCTFLGGENSQKEDIAMDVTNDQYGNIYSIGNTCGGNFPVYLGQFMTYGLGFHDAFIAKFNNNYSRKWITYFGGNDDDRGYGITFDNLNNKLYVCGLTSSSSSNIFAKPLNSNPNSYVDNLPSFDKGFIARFDELGTREWSTFFGGTGSQCSKIKSDMDGNIYVIGSVSIWENFVAGCTFPTGGGFPICSPGSGSYQQYVHAGGTTFGWDGYIARFNSNTELTWSTLFGGAGDDFFMNLAVDNKNKKLYVVGSTNSQAQLTPLCWGNGLFPTCDGGGYLQTKLNGSNSGNVNDGFILKFSLLNAGLEWSTLFGGNGDEGISGVDVNQAGQVVVVGYTSTSFYGDGDCVVSGNGGFPSCNNGSWHQPFGGGMDSFIASFELNSAFRWSSFIGSTSDEGATELLCDEKVSISNDNTIFMGGTTRSGSAILTGTFPVIPNSLYYQQNTHADYNNNSQTNTDNYLMAFNNNGVPVWSSYFGGIGYIPGTFPRHGDFFGGISTFSNRIFVCGGTYSTSDFPLHCPNTTNPYCQPNTATDSRDAFMAQVTIDNSIGINDNLSKYNSNIIVAPNPTTDGNISIMFDSKVFTVAELTVYNILGDIVKTKTIKVSAGSNNQSFNISDLPEGVYILLLNKNNELSTFKLVKQ